MRINTCNDYSKPLCESIEVEPGNVLCESGGTEQFDEGRDYSSLFGED